MTFSKAGVNNLKKNQRFSEFCRKSTRWVDWHSRVFFGTFEAIWLFLRNKIRIEYFRIPSTCSLSRLRTWQSKAAICAVTEFPTLSLIEQVCCPKSRERQVVRSHTKCISIFLIIYSRSLGYLELHAHIWSQQTCNNNEKWYFSTNTWKQRLHIDDPKTKVQIRPKVSRQYKFVFPFSS